MGGQIPEAAFQSLPIVQPGAHHHLGVNLEIPFTEPGQLLHQQPSPWIHEQPLA